MRLRHRVQVIKLLNVFERWLTQNSGVVLFISFTRVTKKSLIFSTLDEIENIWFVPLTKAHLGNSELYSKETFRKVFFLTKVTNFLSTICFISPIIEKKSRILSLQKRQIFYKSYVDKEIISNITDFIFSVDLVHILRKSWQIFVPYKGPLFRYNWVLQEEPSTSSL